MRILLRYNRRSLAFHISEGCLERNGKMDPVSMRAADSRGESVKRLLEARRGRGLI